MDDIVLAFLGFVAVFVVLAVAALRFGVDSRSLTRERPLPSESVVRVPPDISRYRRALLARDALREHALQMPIYRADDPLTRGARGTGRLAKALHLYERAPASGSERRCSA
jgi:hypothetical protein